MAKKTILVVDDEPNIVSLLTKMLSNDYTVHSARNGQEAVDNVKKIKPDLIIMDIMMPKMDGYTACAAMKKDPSTSGIPVIMLTGVDFDLNREFARRVGANAYLTKPFSLIDLKRTIEPLLSKS
jgi:CheY-like chemotaxis protein